MKQPKKLKRDFKQMVASQGLNPCEWMLLEEKTYKLVLVKKATGTIRAIDKVVKKR